MKKDQNLNLKSENKNSCTLDIENLTRIVGHTSLDVKIENNKAVFAKLRVEETKRFIEEALIGKHFMQAPQIVSRICGTCGISHQLASIETIEKAFGFTPSDQTIKLRNLSSYANVLRDHALHLYFLSLPDIMQKDSVFDFEKKYDYLIKDALDVKKAGNMLASCIGGRSVHPANLVPGGVLSIPKADDIKNTLAFLHLVRPKVINCIELFSEDKFTFPSDSSFIALKTKGFDFLEGTIKTSKGLEIPETDFGKHLKEFILPYSTADSFKFDGTVYMVGALARINLNKEELHKNTIKDTKKYLKLFPANCVFKNNLAQAIEMLHCIDASIDILSKTKFKTETVQTLSPKLSSGTGVVEAPRGTLYHHYDFDSSGKIVHADLVIPTAQNIIKIEQDIVRLINSLLPNTPKSKVSFEVEKLIRAFDPCMNCATHFLKINWK